MYINNTFPEIVKLDDLWKTTIYNKEESPIIGLSNIKETTTHTTMRKALYVILTALLFVYNISGIKAQGYPVQATLNIGLPHSPLLEDYYSGANPLFNLNVLYKDFNSTRPLPVRINFTIESNNGFKLTTNPSFTPQPLYINGGENYRIEDSELSQYFVNSALLITGSSSNNFANQHRLPEGFYRITLRVHEYHRNIPISNIAIAVVWIKDNDPPQWVMPQNNTTIKARFPQNISFSWMKRHIPPPVGKSEVVYRFELFEMNNPSVTPEVVVRSQRPLYSEDVENTTLIYSADKPMLTPGKSYVCRIQAKDELNYLRFKNSGYSTPLKFTFGKECRKPYNIQIQEPTKSGVTVDWQTDYFGDPTELRIRETGANQSEWYGYNSSNQTVNVHQLYAGRDYEIQLRNVCDQDLYSEWTQPQALRTQSSGTTNNNQRNCTGKEISVDITDPTPLAVLEVGDIITVNGFPVTITSVEGSNGIFSGTGDMFVPFTGGKIQSVFSNITVTNSMQVSAGQVRAVRGPKVTFTNQGSDNNSSDDTDDDSDKFTVTGDTLTLTNGGGIDSLYLNGDGDVIIIDTHGDTINTGKKDITIVDNTGGTGDTDSDTTDTYVVQGGTITKTSGPASTGTGGSSGSGSQSVNDSNIRLQFISPIDDGSGGFDRPQHQVMISGGAYNSRQYNGNNYYVPWRSVESGKSAFIVAELKIENDTLKAEHITFTNDAGVKLPVQPATGPDKKATYVKVLINGTSHEEVQRVTAGYTIKNDKGESENRELAWIDVISYSSEPVDLVIATANGQKPTVPLSRLEQELNLIYGQSVIRFRLSQIDLGNTDFDKNGDNLVDAGSTGMLSNYTAETRAIKRAVRRHQAYDKKAFYIVMVPEASEGAMLKGHWALKTQVGFVFNPKGMSDEQFIHTVAHESGHGIFRLWHTFSSKNNYQLAKGATTNLMDYTTKPNATDLFKYQWDYCHNPENMTGLFQDDEEGEFVFGETAIENIVRAVRNVRCAKENNVGITNLYFSNYSYIIEIKDLVTAFSLTGSDVSNEKIKFFISNGSEINLDYFEDEFDVNNIKYNENKNQVVLNGKKRSLFIKPYDVSSGHKAEIYSFIKTMFDTDISIKDPRTEDVNGMEQEKLRYLSVCQLSLMSDNRRKEILESISEQTTITAKDEKLVINILRTTKNKSTIYSLLQDGKLSIDLYKGMNTYKQEFVFLFNWICEASWTASERQKAKILFLGTDNRGNRFQLSENDWMFGDCLDETEVRVWNLEDLGGKYSNKFTSAPVAPIRIAYFNGNTKIVSTFMVDYMRSQENNEEWTEAFFDYLTGIGLSSAGRLLVAKSTPQIIRFLSVIEFGKTNIDIVFKDERVKTKLKNNGHDWFVNNWQKISTAIDVATFGSEMLINFAKKGDDLSKVLRENGNTKAANEIDDITTEAKALTESVEYFSNTFNKLSTKSSLNASLFRKLDNMLASAPSIKFNYGSKSLQSPKQFLNSTGSEMYDLILSNGTYAKFDNTTGRLLYSDGKNQYFVRYTTGNNTSNVEQLITDRVTKLRNCLGLNGNQTIPLTQGLGAVTTSSNKVTTFIGKTTETQLLKNQFGDFKHIEVGETVGSVNLLNMPDPYWNPSTWFEDYNKDWMLRAINRGDDIYIASKIERRALLNETEAGIQFGSYYANELNELIKAGIKPKNITQSEWDQLTPIIIDAASKKL